MASALSADDEVLAHECVGSRVVSVIAHADDDLYFINPSLDQAIVRGACVHTIVVTEGYTDDHNNNARIAGLQAAYARMAGNEALRWSSQTRVFNEKSMQHFVASGTPRMELTFLNIRAGNHDSIKDQSPANLYQLFAEDAETETSGDTVEVYYNEASLIATLRSVIQEYDPDTLLTLNPHRPFPVRHSRREGEGAHPDHVIVAKMALMAVADLPRVKAIFLHDDYPIQNRPANLDPKVAERKTEIMRAYCYVDKRGCANAETLMPDCHWPVTGQWGEGWLCRHYPISVVRPLKSLSLPH